MQYPSVLPVGRSALMVAWLHLVVPGQFRLHTFSLPVLVAHLKFWLLATQAFCSRGKHQCANGLLGVAYGLSVRHATAHEFA